MAEPSRKDVAWFSCSRGPAGQKVVGSSPGGSRACFVFLFFVLNISRVGYWRDALLTQGAAGAGRGGGAGVLLAALPPGAEHGVVVGQPDGEALGVELAELHAAALDGPAAEPCSTENKTVQNIVKNVVKIIYKTVL